MTQITNKFLYVNSFHYFYSSLLALPQKNLLSATKYNLFETMQQCQFFDSKESPSSKTPSTPSTHNKSPQPQTVNTLPQTTIDYETFPFEQYFDRSADLQQQNPQPEPTTLPLAKKTSAELIQQLTHNLQSNQTLKEGYLQRQTYGVITKWEKRYCVLTSKQLFCYQDDKRQNLLSSINIRLLPCSVSQQYELVKIYYCVKSSPIVLKAQDSQEAVAWWQQLRQVIDRNLSNKKIYLKKGNSCIYSQKNLISEQEFLSQAQTGDILVMKTKQNSSCSLQRLVTHSEYDHVSLVIRYQNGDVQIFESNANEGVALYGWKDYQNRFSFYEQIAYRKLIFEGKKELQSSLLNFVKGTLGKEYDIGAIKLIKQWSSQDKGKRSYFCSELVAKAYKMMGLIEKDKASARYWPVDFTERGGLQLLQGAALGRQKTIVLENHISRYQ